MDIQENVLLGPLTTMKIGGPARFFCRARSDDETVEAIEFARKQKLPLFVLGGGSNLVVADGGFQGLVLQLAMDIDIFQRHNRDRPHDSVAYEVGAGVEWDRFVRTACEAGHTGVECLAGIPGLTGGAPVQNIGAYGQEVSQTIDSVVTLDLSTMKHNLLRAPACGFSYRQSIFNSTAQGRYIVLIICFNLSSQRPVNLSYPDLASLRDKGPGPLEVYRFVREIRARKGMLIDAATLDADSRSAGSFFKNPVVTERVLANIAESMKCTVQEVPHWKAPGNGVKLSAAWLIEQAGFKKGFALGRVGISSRHTLALINRTGDATCSELMRLKDLIVMTVEDQFRILLVQEPVMLGM